jgi:hypothetical protein
VPVCLEYPAGKSKEKTCSLLKEKSQEVVLDKAKGCPAWVLGNAGAVGYYRVSYQGGMQTVLIDSKTPLSASERVDVLENLDALLDAGTIPVADALALVPQLSRDKNNHVVGNGASILASIRELVPENLEPNYARFIRKQFGKKARSLGWSTKKSDDSAKRSLRTQLLRLVGHEGGDKQIRAQARKLAERILKKPETADSDLAGTALSLAAEDGDLALYDRYLALAKSTKNRQLKSALLVGMGAFKQPELLKRNLELSLGDEFSMREVGALLQVPMADPKRRQAVWDFVKTNYDALSAKLPRLARSYLIFTLVPFCDAEHLTEAKSFFTPKLEEIPGGKRTLAQAEEQMELCIAQRKAKQPSVVDFLKKQK